MWTPSPLGEDSETSDEYEEEPETDDDGDPIASVLHRLASSPVQIKVHSVQIKNNSRTNRSLIESELDLDSILKASTLQELVYVAGLGNARLKKLGVFDSVSITIDAGPDDLPGSSVVVVDVAESWPVSGNFAFDSNPEAKAWSLATSLKLKNLLGQADIFDISTSYSSLSPTELTTSFSLPRFKLVPTPLMATLSVSPQNLFNLNSYKNPLTGLSLGLISTLNHDLRYDLTWRAMSYSLSERPHSLRNWFENGVLNSVKYSYKIDERDCNIRPRNGFAFLSTSQIGGFLTNNASSRFFKQEFDLRGAIPLKYLNSSLNLGLSAGLIIPSKSKITNLPLQIPHSYNFTNPSPNSKLGSLSLFKNKKSLEASSPDTNGGDAALNAFVDLSFDLPVDFLRQKGVYFHGFVNVGSIKRLEEIKKFRDFSCHGFLEGSRSSAGFGVILPNKLFRLEINYCYILKKFEHDKGKTGIQFNFSSSK